MRWVILGFICLFLSFISAGIFKEDGTTFMEGTAVGFLIAGGIILIIVGCNGDENG